MELLNHILALLSSIDGQTATIVAVVVEFILRLVKSQKPLSILHAAAAIAKAAGAVLSKAGEVLDKILPQNVAAPAEAGLAEAIEKK